MRVLTLVAPTTVTVHVANLRTVRVYMIFARAHIRNPALIDRAVFVVIEFVRIAPEVVTWWILIFVCNGFAVFHTLGGSLASTVLKLEIQLEFCGFVVAATTSHLVFTATQIVVS